LGGQNALNVDKNSFDGINGFIGVSDDWKTDTLVGIGIGVFYLLIGLYNELFLIGTPQAGLFQFIKDWILRDQFFIVVLIAPIIEGIFFFCFLFTMVYYFLRGVVKAPTMNILVSSLIVSCTFAFFHYAAYGIALQTAYIGAFTFAFLSCLITVWRDSQIPNILLHMVINGAIFFGLFVIVGVT
jgi:hypothetical protein